MQRPARKIRRLLVPDPIDQGIRGDGPAGVYRQRRQDLAPLGWANVDHLAGYTNLHLAE